MSTTPHRPASTTRRRSQVFVEIPITPRNTAGQSLSAHDTKEHSPLRPAHTNTLDDMAVVKLAKTASGKRKSDELEDPQTHDDPPPKLKKAKVSNHAKPEKKKKPSGTAEAKKPAVKASATPDPSADEPKSCHQCGSKRENRVRCTLLRASAKRCRTTYCEACLHNRYYTSLEAFLKAHARSGSSLTKEQRDKHVSEETYYFECYRCTKACNCSICMKNRGLQPLGKFVRKARQGEKTAAAQTDNGNKGRKRVKGAKTTQDAAEGSSSGKVTKPRAKPKSPSKPKPKPKPMPKPTWTHVPTPITQADAESRIGIREFVWRFSDVLQISNANIDELDELSGESLGFSEDWEDGDSESVELYAWISEHCTKLIVLGLVEILAGHAQSKGMHADSAAAKEAAKAIKSTANLNRVWAALEKLSESYPDLNFRSPIPPPTTTVFRHTRSGMQNGMDTIHIASSAQLVPVIEDLIEIVTEMSPIREALDAGTTQEKEFAKALKEAIASENASWKARKEIKDKASRERHNQTLRDLEYSGQLAALHHSPRFTSLGRDSDGRVYYALNPGAGELEAAKQLVQGHDGRVRVGRRRGPWTEDDRRDLQKWAWFVAVWGKKPDGAKVARLDDEDEDEDVDEFAHEETWWGFWQPEEVLTLAEWVSRKADLAEASRDKSIPAKANGHSRSASGSSKGKNCKTVSTSSSLTSLTSSKSSKSARELSPLSTLSSDELDEDAEMEDETNVQGPPVGNELHHLVKGLREYAEMLQWRIARVNHDREDSDGSSTTS